MNHLAYAYMGSQPPSHARSISLGPPHSGSGQAALSKARSGTQLNSMIVDDSVLSRSPEGAGLESSFRTIADPRNTSTPDLSRTGSTSSKRPDLKDEVTTLSDKLVSALEHNTSLDETLAETKRELEASRARIALLESEAKEHEEKRSRGDQLNTKLAAELEDEKKQRSVVQQEKQGIENELENLTQSLFEEANKLVATANKERDAAEKKNQQLRDQIKDGEAVISSQTEQLTELKVLMQEINSEHRRELDSPRVSQAPSSPGVGREEMNLSRFLEAMNLSPAFEENGELSPGPSTALTHLLKPLCRTDIPAYEDFRTLVQTSSVRSHNPSHAPSRAGSGSYGGLNVVGLGSFSNNSNPNISQTSQPATSKLAQSPSIPGSFNQNADVKGPAPLKETRFFKRIMSEDVEPTLRLDLSPTFTWLQRRSVLAALADSSLIVEPIPEASLKLYGKYTPCAICGENRKENQNPRTHGMRIREGEGVARWSICKLCLEKVRGVGDLIAYVRMVREGIIKCGDKKEEEEAWEELVKRRERLFWARMAGGVVPAFIPSNKNSPIVGADKVGGEGALHTEAGKGNNTPSFETPNQSRRGSDDTNQDDESTKSEKEAQLQLQQGLDDSLTTFENLKDKRTALRGSASATTPPNTPPRKKESVFPKINIPKLPDGFWASQVNTLH